MDIMQKIKQSARGGKREGAGRKLKYSEHQSNVSAYLPNSLIDRLDEEAAEREVSRNEVIVRRLLGSFRRNPKSP